MRAGLASIALLLSLGCINPFGGRDVRLDIESIEAPESIGPQQPLTITATVVSGGCRTFDRLVVKREGQRISLAAWGEDSSGPFTACTTDIRYDRPDHVATGPFSDPVTVVAYRLDGTLLERVVRVR